MELRESCGKNTGPSLQAWVQTTSVIYLLCDQRELPVVNMKDYSQSKLIDLVYDSSNQRHKNKLVNKQSRESQIALDFQSPFLQGGQCEHKRKNMEPYTKPSLYSSPEYLTIAQIHQFMRCCKTVILVLLHLLAEITSIKNFPSSTIWLNLKQNSLGKGKINA